MGNKEINPVVAVVAGVVVLGLAAFFGFRAVQAPAPPPGSYTPGVPPWMDKSHTSNAPVRMPPNSRTATH